MNSLELRIQNHLRSAIDSLNTIYQCENDLDLLFGVKNTTSIIPPPVNFLSLQNSETVTQEIIYPENFSQIIGSTIKTKRESLGITQNELADLTGIKRPNIARLEKGTTYPNMSTLIKISQGLKISLIDLLNLT
ncbi:MAG: helix-turn-helix transcriptional regulator [Deltaproteobacteria bacterium]|nr:helix-turn-helix transcriptional regulator [Deltaproteobacteria bacterium]